MPKGFTAARDLFEVVDELPPTSGGQRGMATSVVARLRTEAPGRWVKVRSGDHSHTSFVNALRKQGVETHLRTIDGAKVVFARWPGEAGETRRRSGHAAANDRAAAAALQTRTRPVVAAVPTPKPEAVPTPAVVAPAAEVAQDLSTTERMSTLRKAIRDWPVARRAGFRTTDLLDRIPDDVLVGSTRPDTLIEVAMDAQLHGRVVAWLAEESAA